MFVKKQKFQEQVTAFDQRMERLEQKVGTGRPHGWSALDAMILGIPQTTLTERLDHLSDRIDRLLAYLGVEEIRTQATTALRKKSKSTKTNKGEK